MCSLDEYSINLVPYSGVGERCIDHGPSLFRIQIDVPHLNDLDQEQFLRHADISFGLERLEPCRGRSMSTQMLLS
jgi:hypothetical protein